MEWKDVMITDAYTVQFLLEGTLANPPRVVWSESARTGLAANAGGVAVDLARHHDRTGARISLRLRHGADSVSVHEPLNLGWLRKRYHSEDDERLAGLLTHLWSAAVAQRDALPMPAEARDRLYRRLLFEN